MSVAVCLDGFEGPLDLLIHLIQKNKINICEIAISQITNQYLNQIREWQKMDLEIASEFVVMASRLLEIKARALLPKKEAEEEDQENLEKKLVRQLMEYKIFKEISSYFKEQEEKDLMAIYKDPEYIPQEEEKILEIDPFSLADAFKRLLLKKETDQEEEAILPQHLVREVFSIEDKIEEITKALEKAGEQGLSFTDLLYKEISREEVVVTLLSLLEMVKTQGIRLFQERVFLDFAIRGEAC